MSALHRPEHSLAGQDALGMTGLTALWQSQVWVLRCPGYPEPEQRTVPA